MKKRGNSSMLGQVRGRLIKDKSGQFYLIAAIIIATVIIGLATISNYSRIEPNVKIYDLKEEIKTESRHVFDYGLNQGYTTDAQFYNLMVDFTDDYVDYQKDKDLYFIFGSETNISISGYQKGNKTVSLNGIRITNEAGRFAGSINPGGVSQIILGINNLQYIFQINEGRNFYLVIAQKTEGGEHIVSG